MKYIIEFWLLPIGGQFINKETAMKCLQSLTEFFEQHSKKTHQQ